MLVFQLTLLSEEGPKPNVRDILDKSTGSIIWIAVVFIFNYKAYNNKLIIYFIVTKLCSKIAKNSKMHKLQI